MANTPASAFINHTGQRAATYFYNVFPLEPISGGGTLEVSVAESMRRIDAFALLGRIIRHGAKLRGGTVLIVDHGVVDGMDMKLAPVATSRARLQNNAIGVLRRNESGKVSDGDAAKMLGLPSKNFVALRQRRQQVAALRLSRVEARACNVAYKKETLENLRWFFGASHFGGPTVLDVFGLLTPPKSTSVADFEKWIKDHPRAKVEGSVGNRIAYIQGGSGLLGDWRAESRSSAEAWATRRFPKGTPTRGKPIPYHGLLYRGYLVFPNQPAYRRMLAHV